MNWLKNRLKERSTWLGIITLASIAGLNISPEQKELVITIGMAAAALLATFTADTKPVVEVEWRAPEATQTQSIVTPDITEGIKG